MPHAERSRASRMRENRLSGLMRGGAAASLPPSYSTDSVEEVYQFLVICVA